MNIGTVMQKTILVTGGCGFIGVNFVRLLLETCPDWQVVNLDKLTYAGNLQSLENVADHPRHTFIRGDICDAELIDSLFAEYAIDTVVHFAAESHVDRSITGPDAFVRTNVFGTFALLEAAKKYWLDQGRGDDGCRFLHVSTDEVYGSLGEASSDHFVRAYFHTYGLPILITNCSNNYGPYQFPEKLIPLVLNNALHGKELPVYGDGGNVRDWLYVRDHCEAIVRVLEHGRAGEAYNIGGHNEKRNLEVVELLCDMLDSKVGPQADGQPRRRLITFVKDRLGHDRRYAIDAGKMDRELGWRPQYSFEQGLEKTVTWYLNNRKWSESVMDGTYRQYYAAMYGQGK